MGFGGFCVCKDWLWSHNFSLRRRRKSAFGMQKRGRSARIQKDKENDHSMLCLSMSTNSPAGRTIRLHFLNNLQGAQKEGG